MKRLTAVLAALGAVSVATLAAQTQSAGATASVTVASQLTLVKTQDMAFGSHFASDGTVLSGGSVQADWSGTTSPNPRPMDFSFVIPASLSDGIGHNVPFSCGSISAVLSASPNPVTEFNPASGTSGYVMGSATSFTVSLGSVATASQACAVNLSGAPAGAYSGTITLTVTIT